MAGSETNLLLVILIAAVSLMGLGLAASSISTQQSFNRMMGTGMGGGMMSPNQTASTVGTGPGPLEWAVLVLSVVFLGASVVLFYRGRVRASPAAPLFPAPVAAEPQPAGAAGPAVTTPAPPALTAGVAEPALIKLLDEDERRMYLEIRDHGGTILQRDLVALGTFSKAKVTRVLDKLEAKGIVVREAYGMTNRVRILNAAR